MFDKENDLALHHPSETSTDSSNFHHPNVWCHTHTTQHNSDKVTDGIPKEERITGTNLFGSILGIGTG